MDSKLREAVIAKMENNEYELKPCPWCGGRPKLMTKKFFEGLHPEEGACITIECEACDACLYEHTHDESNYYVRAFLVTEKWNRRV